MTERQPPPARFEATLHRGERHRELRTLPPLDLDRLPSPPDEFRVLLTAEEAGRLVELGFEVRLLRACPIKPLDQALVMDDETARAMIEDRLADRGSDN